MEIHPFTNVENDGICVGHLKAFGKTAPTHSIPWWCHYVPHKLEFPGAGWTPFPFVFVQGFVGPLTGCPVIKAVDSINVPRVRPRHHNCSAIPWSFLSHLHYCAVPLRQADRYHILPFYYGSGFLLLFHLGGFFFCNLTGYGLCFFLLLYCCRSAG